MKNRIPNPNARLEQLTDNINSLYNEMKVDEMHSRKAFDDLTEILAPGSSIRHKKVVLELSYSEAELLSEMLMKPLMGEIYASHSPEHSLEHIREQLCKRRDTYKEDGQSDLAELGPEWTKKYFSNVCTMMLTQVMSMFDKPKGQN